MIPTDFKYDHLLGLRFTGIGQQDCFELQRDFFKTNFNIDVPSYARPSDWRADDHDLIRDLYEDAGFEIITDWKVKDLRPGDVLAMTINESNPNHLAVYLGNDTILHHLAGRLSREEPFHGFWRNHTSFLLRHPDVPDLRPPIVTMNLMDVVNKRMVEYAEPSAEA